MSQSGTTKSAGTGKLKILLVLPESEDSISLVRSFKRAGFDARALFSVDAAALAMTHYRPAAVLLDAAYLADRGHRLMETLRLSSPDSPILVLADSEDEQLRLKSLLLGAEDCLARPLTDQEAVVRVRRAVERRAGLRRLANENQGTRERAGRMRLELGDLRGQLLRNVALLQRGVDFHQRLNPDHGLGHLMECALGNLSAQVSIDRLVFLGRTYPEASWFTTQAAVGLPVSLGDVLRVPTSGELASILRSSGGPVLLDRLGNIPGTRLELGVVATGGFTALIPILSHTRLLGIVLVGEGRGGGAPSQDTLQLAQFLLSSLAPAILAQGSREEESHMTVQALGALVSRLEAKDPYLRGHSLRVARLAEELGERIGLERAELSRLNIAAVLHDIGRFEVDTRLWSKTEPLTSEDWDLIRLHPEEGERLAARSTWPPQVLAAIRSHHECWDGSGYPDGLSGEAIPIEARIIAVADTFEAVTSPRVHRRPMTHIEAIAVLRREAGARLDPDLVGRFLEEPRQLLLA